MLLFLVTRGRTSMLRCKRKKRRKKGGGERRLGSHRQEKGERRRSHPCPHIPMSPHPHIPTSPHPHVPTSPYTTQCHWRNPISLLVLSALSDHLQKLMQCIYILDTPYLFEVTYVIYLDTIVCHLCTAFFLSLFFFF